MQTKGTAEMLTGTGREVAEDLEQRFLAHDGSRIPRVILYGSRARDTATPDSDFDLLVVEANPVARSEEVQRLGKANQWETC